MDLRTFWLRFAFGLHSVCLGPSFAVCLLMFALCLLYACFMFALVAVSMLYVCFCLLKFRPPSGQFFFFQMKKVRL